MPERTPVKKKESDRLFDEYEKEADLADDQYGNDPEVEKYLEALNQCDRLMEWLNQINDFACSEGKDDWIELTLAMKRVLREWNENHLQLLNISEKKIRAARLIYGLTS